MSGKSLGQVACENRGYQWDMMGEATRRLWESAAAAVVAAHEAAKWKRVEDGLPEERLPVLVVFSDGEMRVAWVISGEFYADDGSPDDGNYFLNITHWAKLPSAPGGGK